VPTENVKLDGSIGYVDPVYDKFLFLDPNTGATADIKDSAKFPYVPRWTMHVGAEYTFPPLGFGTLTARSDYAYTSSRYFFATEILNPANEAIKDPGQHLLSARLILSEVSVGGGATLEASFFGENLLNEDIRVAGIDFGSSIGMAGDNFGPPRLFGFEMKVKY
jgi:iron complex outermembrane receptor protein